MTQSLGLIAGGIAALGYLANIHHVLTNTHREKSLTPWIIWSLVGVLLFKSYVTVGGADNETADSGWVLLVYAIGPPAVLALLVLHREIRSSPFSLLDKLFLVTSFASGLYLWWFDEGILPLHVNALIDASGGVLLAHHVWRSPHAESLLAWSLFGVAGIFNLFAIQHWSYVYAMYPVVLAVMTTSLPVVIAARRVSRSADL